MSILREQRGQKIKAAGKHYDNLNEICQRFMMWIRKEYPGHKTEISPKELTKRAKRFSIAFGMSEADLLDALLRRRWIEADAGDTWHLRYDKAGL